MLVLGVCIMLDFGLLSCSVLGLYHAQFRASFMLGLGLS